jgi:hypothetical protein
VIVTDHTGSVARHGQDGCIVPLGDVDAILDALELLEGSPDVYRSMSESALGRAAEYRVDCYGTRLLAALPPASRAVPSAYCGFESSVTGARGRAAGVA